MTEFVRERTGEIAAICRRRSVRHLAVFGSATDERFDPTSSDLDFVVEFSPLEPSEHANAYFGLLADLENLFGMHVDLVERRPIRNPYFRRAVEETQVTVYEAA